MSLMEDALKESLGIMMPQPGDPEFDGMPPTDGYPVIKLEIKEMVSELPKETVSDTVKDYHHARNLTYTLLDMTGDALAGSLKVAKETEHPRAYGVFNELAVTMRSLTQDLLALQKTYKEVTKDRPDLQPVPPVVNNTQINNFGASASGSTTDIIRMMKEQKEFIDAELNVVDASVKEIYDGNITPTT